MRHLRVRGASARRKLPHTRSAALFAVALLAGGVLGPLAGMAVGASSGTTTVITSPPGCTVAATTTTATTTTATTTNTTTTTTTTPTLTGTVTATTPTTPPGAPVDETAYFGQYVSIQIVAPGVPTPVYNVSPQPLPAGLSLSSTGVISGTVGSSAASVTMTVTATDATDSNITASVQIAWNFSPAPTQTQTLTTTTPITITTPPPPTCTTTTIKVPPYVPPTNTAAAPGAIKVPKGNALARHGMWIWELSATDHGDVAEIIAQAKADGIGTLFIKSGDGVTAWSQFNKALVAEIHAAKLKVCAWQYVYGNHPLQEAEVGALAKQDGADCLVIDAEVQYQGKYVAAQTYIKDLRKRIGNKYPLGLAGLPYIQYHTNFPYSVFLGPNAAQYNLPQMYWIDIGTTVPYVYETTYEYNEIYQRPIFPLGQLYADSEGSPNPLSIGQFNTIAKDYKATGVSWWDFQSATSAWMADTNHTEAAPADFIPLTNAATLVKGNLGDIVVWAQEHLDGAGADLAVDGDFGSATEAAVKAFQASHRIAVSGKIDGRTWDALLRYRAVRVSWSGSGKLVYATITRGGHRLSSVVALRSRASRAAAARREAR